MELDFSNRIPEPEPFFPDFVDNKWPAVRVTLQGYARMLSGIRKSMDAPQPHQGHAGLRVGSTGMTTTPIMAPNGIVFEMTLDLVRHCLHITTSRAGVWMIPFFQQSTKEMYWQLRNIMTSIGIEAGSFENAFTLDDGPYDKDNAVRFHTALTQVDFALKRFRGEIRTQMSLVNFWPQSFHLSMNAYTGRIIAGVDPKDEAHADERMSFGFSPGDDENSAPHFFVSVYPWDERIRSIQLCEDATWSPGQPGTAVLPYEAIHTKSAPFEYLIDYYKQAYYRISEFLQANAG